MHFSTKNQFYIVPDIKQLDRSLALAEKYDLGFEANDFWGPEMLDNEEETENRIAIFRNVLSEHPGITMTNHGDFFDVILFSTDPLIREIAQKRIRQSIDVSLKLGAHAVIFHTNHSPQLKAKFYLTNWKKRNEEFFSEMLSEYPDINIYIENMFDDTPDVLAGLAECLKGYDNFGVCLDYAHASAFGRRVPIKEWVETLRPYVKHLHINDNNLVNDLHLAVGDGKIDWLQFKEYYNMYFKECTTLIETSSLENQLKSLQYMQKIGLI